MRGLDNSGNQAVLRTSSASGLDLFVPLDPLDLIWSAGRTGRFRTSTRRELGLLGGLAKFDPLGAAVPCFWTCFC